VFSCQWRELHLVRAGVIDITTVSWVWILDCLWHASANTCTHTHTHMKNSHQNLVILINHKMDVKWNRNLQQHNFANFMAGINNT
jgi:hypothetical protein